MIYKHLYLLNLTSNDSPLNEKTAETKNPVLSIRL